MTLTAGRVDALLQRIHPAESRIQRLSQETPATLLPFDLLAEGDESLLALPFSERRERLAKLLDGALTPTTATPDPAVAEVWLDTTEGVIAKETSASYKPGKRAGMWKVKRVRTIDCVVIGYREGKEPETVGSLILALTDDDGQLVPMGHSSGFSAKQKRELLDLVRPYETGDRGSGEVSRWTQGRELEWVGLRPELVVEVSFDHASGGRIRHGARLHRFRDDKRPDQCLLADFSAAETAT